MKFKTAKKRGNFITYLNIWTKFKFFIVENNNRIEKCL